MKRRRSPETMVLDTWSLMAFFLDEPAAGKVQRLLTQAEAKGKRVILGELNWGELYYNVARKLGEEVADRVHVELLGLPLVIACVDRELILAAAKLKAKFPISFADCFVAATAQRYKGKVVTGDPEFKKLEGEIEIYWLR